MVRIIALLIGAALRLRARAGAVRHGQDRDHRSGARNRRARVPPASGERRAAVGRPVRQVRPAPGPARLPGLQGSLLGLPLAEATSRSATCEQIGYTEAEVKAIASQWAIEQPSDQPAKRARPRRARTCRRDRFPSPFANEIAARAANNNALPPDLSLMTKARAGRRELHPLAADRLSRRSRPSC